MIVWMNVVLNIGLFLTVTDVLTTCVVVIFGVKVSCITSVDGISSTTGSKPIYGNPIQGYNNCTL